MRFLRWLLCAALLATSLVAAALLYLRFLPPLVTAVQIQQWLAYSASADPPQFHSEWVPLERISADLQHAVIASEDSRFYRHSGLDLIEMRKSLQEDLEEGEIRRGGSTITQQLVKNLFLTTSRSFVRKAIEVPLALLADLILPKRRILELYLNVVEWAPGVYGAEAAARHYYGIPASQVGREQAARLAAVLPSPRRRRPERMSHSAARIMRRMRQMGW